MACIERIKHNTEECTKEKGLQVFYSEETKKYSGFCFSCNAKGLPAYVADPYNGEKKPEPKVKSKEEIFEDVQEVRALSSPNFEHRGIPASYYKRYGVKIALSEEDGKSNFSLNFPYIVNGKLGGYKVRPLAFKAFWSVGNIVGADLFNWYYAKKKGVRRLFITESEIDCISLEYMLEQQARKSGSKYNTFAVTSLPFGAGSAVTTLGRMRKDIESSFEQVVLVFDQDVAGQKAVDDVVKIWPDVLVCPYPTSAKDANEALQAGDGAIFANYALWKSRKPTIEGVVNVSTVLKRSTEPPKMGLSYPWEGLTDLTYGQRFGECTAWGAGVGLGKSAQAHEIAAHNIKEHKENVFGVFLEEEVHESLWNISGKMDSLPYHRPECAKENWEQYLETARGLDGRLFLWESSVNVCNRFDIDEILKAIRFNTLEYGVRFHVIDNMTRLVDHLSSSDANEFINKYSSEIANMATELSIHIDVYSHLNQPRGKGEVDHESGGEVKASQFTGSRGIMRSFPVLGGFERNKHAEGDLKNNSYMSIIKNRKYGGEGKIKTQYNPKTGRLLEYDWDGDSLY